MIEFFCRCHHRFEVPDDQAGELIQCPQCGLLRDVPTVSDLKGLDDQGLYKLDATPESEPDRLAKLGHVFRPGRVDEDGNEIDLRPTFEQIAESGSEEIPLELAGEIRPAPPKYDPETGELIRPIELKNDPKPVVAQEIPLAKPALNYASRSTTTVQEEINPATALAHLFTPLNLIVIVFIMIAHVLTQFVVIPTMVGLFLLVPVTFFMNMLIVSHYACVVEETGPDARDELPRPLRHMEWHEDLWGPFVKFSAAVLYCFLPTAIASAVHFPPDIRNLVIAAMALVGCVVFPAALLTTVTSGTYLNLRPDRVLDVIWISGWKYVLAVFVFLVTCFVYPMGQYFVFYRAISLFSSPGFGKAYQWFGSYGMLFLGVVLMHYFCWLLGLLYREHQQDYPWLLQRHNPVNLVRHRPVYNRPDANRVGADEPHRRGLHT